MNNLNDNISSLLLYVLDEIVFGENENIFQFMQSIFMRTENIQIFSIVSIKPLLREYHFRLDPEDLWLHSYHENIFFQLFRMKKDTFYSLLDEVLENDNLNLIKKKYRGGHYPVQPERSLLVFLWYMSKQDTLHSISDRFNMVPSTVMQIINAFLYIVNFKLRNKYIAWPKSEQEYDEIKQQFQHYPGVVGAIDGTKIKIKVPSTQHDSYIDRYHDHSITVMAVCTFHNIITYAFVGFPGSAHDSRVFSNSVMARHIETYGPRKYFPNRDCHLLGDSAFPLKEWLMTPYRQVPNITREQKYHNYRLSADRIAIEHTFGLVKGRWRRIIFINTYSISKAIEITNAAFILHNFCYIHGDKWAQPHEQEEVDEFVEQMVDRLSGEIKRNNICQFLNQ